MIKPKLKTNIFFLIAAFSVFSVIRVFAIEVFEREALQTESANEIAFSSFSVFVRENAAIITCKSKNKNASFILYRAIEPFISAASLADAIPIAHITENELPFFDFPIQGIPYYYAVLEEKETVLGTVKFIHGKNTWNKPVEITSSSENGNFSGLQKEPRSLPLPYLNPDKKIKPKPRYFSSSTENIIASLSAENEIERKSSPAKRNIKILPNEENTPQGGETSALQEIVIKYLSERRWKTCEAELKKFLSLRHTERVEARARFYLGQTYFFTERYDKALIEFLQSKRIYEKPSQEWIRYCLPELQNSVKEM